MKYSVIDISSSGLSMIVASTDNKKTEIIFKDRAGMYLLPHLEGRRLSQRGMDKLADALSVMKEKCENLGVDVCYVISTAALRFVDNYEDIGAYVAEKTGLPVNFIDGKTEAYCDFVANEYYASYDRAVLIDLGGKSLEICDLSKKEKDDMCYLDFGLVDLHRKFVKKYQPDEEEAEEIKKYGRARFDKEKLPKKDAYATAVMVGTTNCALYDIYSEFAKEKAADGVKTIDYGKFKKLVKNLISGPDRSGLIINNAPEKLVAIGPAAIVLKVLFKRFGVDNIIVSDKGVKEGYLQLVLCGKEQGKSFDFRNSGETSVKAKGIKSVKNTQKAKNVAEADKICDEPQNESAAEADKAE